MDLGWVKDIQAKMALFENIDHKLYFIIKAKIKEQEKIVFTSNSGSAQYCIDKTLKTHRLLKISS